VTTYGLTSTGFVRKTYEQILKDQQTFLRAKISPSLVLDETTVEGNIAAITADQLDQAWEALEAAVGALDPDNAAAALLVSVCKLTGILRKGASQGTVLVDLVFDQATTIAANSLLLSVTGQAANLWSNDNEISVAAAGSVTGVPFTSVLASSSAVAPSGTLAVIATPKTGLVSATNPLDATGGADIEPLDALRLRREASLGSAGQGTTLAIRAAVVGDDTGDNPGVSGIEDCRVVENDTGLAVDGIPPRTLRVIVWDGPTAAADDDAIAAAIYASKGAGTPTYGAVTGEATDPWGDTKYVHFDRATELPAYVSVATTGTAGSAAIAAAILGAHSEFIGTTLLYAALVSAVYLVEGVSNVTSLTLGFSASPAGTADLSAATDEVITLDTSRIVIT
jgi:uncharacterized phage protein gp47/JayE